MSWRPLRVAIVLISMTGFLAAAWSAAALKSSFARTYGTEFLLMAAGTFLLSWWSRRMPSGVTLNPGVVLATSGIILLPPALVLIPALPALAVVAFRERQPWWRYPLTFGHAALSLYPSALLYQAMAPVGRHRLGAMIPGAAAAILLFEVVHTVNSAVMVAHRENRAFTDQMGLIFRRDWNWGILGLNVLGVAMAAHYMHGQYWGIVGQGVLIVCVYQAITYFSAVTLWQEAAWTDGLTRVGNRSAWEAYVDTLKKAEEKPSGTLIVVDVDGLKDLNDRHGHVAGDQALIELAGLLQTCLRKSDRIFRYGGDEFVVFLPHAPGADGFVRERVTPVLERFGQAWSEQGVRVSASIGMATMPTEAPSLDQLFELADGRMYANKAVRRLAAGKLS